jgi:hypothetical protein
MIVMFIIAAFWIGQTTLGAAVFITDGSGVVLATGSNDPLTAN